MIILLSEMREFLMLLTGLFACACGTSELARDVVVNDSVEYLDVQAARRNVRGHQEIDCAIAKQL